MAEEDDLSQDADALAEAIGGGPGDEVDPLAEEMLKAMESGEGEGGGDMDQMMEMEMLKAMEQDRGGLAGLEGMEGAAPSVPATGGSGVPPNIARLMDVRLMVTIELGRTKKTVQQVLDLGEQSLIELDKSVGEPVNVMVNGRLFARGEVVTVSENFGVRITELVSPLNTAL
ncbi:MAG: flagellar motor switch protein FliN [Candidatus Latescibacteria bacterium]|nr:flagellar motor switch protein FliN [Candidatus Latescibacterota bacterium]